MSLTQERYAITRGDAGTIRGEEREPDGYRSRWAGVLLVSAGILLIAPAVAEAMASGVTGSEGSEVLHGSGWNERITGLGGDDELYGGEGVDYLFAGEGDDFVESSDGERDFVSCGPGMDVASVDFVDLVAGDCETVYPG